MGLLVDGVWRDDSFDTTRMQDGRFNRPTTQIPQLGHARRQRRPLRRRRLRGRGRPLSPLRLARLPVGAPHHHLPQAQGAGERRSRCRCRPGTWASRAGPSTRREGSSGDTVNGAAEARRDLSAGRSALHRPRHRAGAVGQEAQHHRQQRVVRDHPHAQFGVRRASPTRTPTTIRPALRARDRRASTTWSIANVNNGVYRAGFATDAGGLRGSLPRRVRDARRRSSAGCRGSAIVAGARLTEADWRLFTTLVRFDAVYYSHFKCNLRRIVDYPNLSNYLRDLYQVPGVAETVSIDHIKRHYYGSQRKVNPTGIVPLGPALDFTAPHDRDRFVS